MIARKIATLLAFASLSASGIAHAQTGDEAAGNAFRQTVEAACTSAASAALDDARATVDPSGSASYGLALVSGILKGSRETRSVICAYDRKTKRAEVGSPIDLGAAAEPAADFTAGGGNGPGTTAATLIYPGTPDCRQECLAHWTALLGEDQNQLTALPEQVRRTLAEVQAGDGPAPVEAARKAALSVIAAAGGRPDADTAPDLGPVQPGNRSCMLLRFGYLGQAPGVESRFACGIDRLANGLLLIRTSDKRNFIYQVQMLGSGLAVVGGRNAPFGPPPGGYDLSKPADPVDRNYGNQVGLAIARPDGQLFIASIDERDLADKDPNFFRIVAIDRPKGK